jgi:hypothetical protein
MEASLGSTRAERCAMGASRTAASRQAPMIQVGAARTIAGSWKRSCGLPAPAHHGAISIRSSAAGTRSSAASADGQGRACSRKSSTAYLVIPISNTRSSTAQSSGSTSTALAQGGTQNQAIGRSRGGLTTKIVALVDALGNLARFILLPGQRHDSTASASSH